MAGFFSKLFGGGEPEQKARRLDHPRDLRPGDILKMSFVDQSEISGKEFQVTDANFYIYDGAFYPEYILKDRQGEILYMMVEEEDGEESLAFSKKLSKTENFSVIGSEDLDKIMKPGTGAGIVIENIPADLQEWMATKYIKTDDNVKGAFRKGEDGQVDEKFTSYLLMDSTDEYAIEVEKYDSNEVEISVTIYHEFSAIDQMWPQK